VYWGPHALFQTTRVTSSYNQKYPTKFEGLIGGTSNVVPHVALWMMVWRRLIFFLLSPLLMIHANPTKIKIYPSICFYFNYSHSLNCSLFVLKSFFYLFFFNFIIYQLILFDFISNMVLILLVDIYPFVNWTCFSISSLIILIRFIFMSIWSLFFFFGSFFLNLSYFLFWSFNI